MTQQRIFISSVQREFSNERKRLYDYIRQDPMLKRFFEPFLFEELPAIDLSAQQAYLYEVNHCDIYLAILGQTYGFVNDNEKAGTGTSDLIEKCILMGLKQPVFFQDEGFKVTIWRNTEINIATRTDTRHPISTPFSTPFSTPILTKMEQSILTVINEKNSITREELANFFNISVNAIKKHIKNLKQKGIIERMGNNRSGHWNVLDNTSVKS